MYHILGFKFFLSFGLHIKHVDGLPMYFDEEGEDWLGEFSGLMLSIPFIDVLIGKLELIMHCGSMDHTAQEDDLML